MKLLIQIFTQKLQETQCEKANTDYIKLVTFLSLIRLGNSSRDVNINSRGRPNPQSIQAPRLWHT